MTIASTATAAKAGLAKRFAALAVAAATLLAGGAIAATASAADDSAPAETNVALSADKGNDNAPDIAVSYVTGWNKTTALNDGSLDGNADYGGWGAWGNTGDHETATYTWDRDVTTAKSVGYYWTNAKTGDAGVLLPKSVSIEYLNADSGKYETVPNLKVDKAFPSDSELDAKNPVYGPYTYTFDQVTTKSLRLVVAKQGNDNKGITVTEWQVLGSSAAEPVDPGDPDAFLYTQQVAVRTTPGADPTAKLPKDVWVTPENGPSLKVPVTWDAVAADAYAKAGTTTEVKGATKAGTYDGIKVEAGQVTATIGVYDQLNTEVTDAEYVSTVTTPGVKPVLQDTVALTYADGSVESGAKVTWADVPKADYAEAEQMGEVSGVIEGTEIKAQGMFFVVAPSDPNAKPLVAIDFDSAAPGSGWYTIAPKFSVSAQRGVSTVPITTVEYKIGGGQWIEGSGPVTVDEQGEVTVSARATDANGNSRETSQSIKVDTAAPKVTAKKESQKGNDVVVALTADDGAKGSSVTRVLYSTGPSSNPKSNENTMWGTYVNADKIKVQLSADHNTYVHYYAQDVAGNESAYANIDLDKGEATPEPTPSVDSVAITGDGVKDGKLALTAGDAAKLAADVKTTGDAAKTVTWKSSDEKIVTVDKDGNVKAVAAGKATITATSTVDESKSASVEVTVKAKEPEPAPVDKTGLKAAVEIAGKLQQSAYTSATWKTFSDALASANKVLADESATQEQVDAARQKLAEAVAGLKPVEQLPTVDKSGLKVSVEVAGKLVEKQYTAESWAKLSEALKNAQAVLDNAKATQDEVTAAQKALVEAVSGLEKVVEPTPTPVVKDGLKATVDTVNAKNLKEADYTPESWKALADALNAANGVLGNESATQADVTDAQTALVKAILGLEKKAVEPTPDKSALQADVDTAKAVDRSLYTDESLKELDDAVAEAQKVLDNADATAEQVTAARTALAQAVGGLKEKTPAPNPSPTPAPKPSPNGSTSGKGNGALSTTGSTVAGVAAAVALLAAAGAGLTVWRKRRA